MDNYNNYSQGGNQSPYNPSVQEQKSNKKIWLLILIPILIIIIGVVIFLFLNSSSKTILDNEFSQGTNIQLKENAEAKFILDDEEHTIKIDSISSDSVTLTIQSNPIQVNLKIGEEKKFDLDDDSFYDVQVKLNGIKNGIPEIYIKKIHENICSENWECTDWSSCTSGQQTRTCTDSNSCGTIEDKPNEQQNCQLQIIDCGISESLNSDEPVNQIDYELDDALVCLGNSLLEDCKPSKAILYTSNAGQIYFEIKKGEDQKCIVRTEYGDEDQIPLEAQKPYANKYSECPLDINQLKSQSNEDPTNKPGTFTFSVYFYIGFESMNPDTECTGTLFDF